MRPSLYITRPIETARLLLRPFEAGDLEALCDLQSRPEVTRYLYWEPRNRRETRGSLRRKMNLTRIDRPGDTINLAVVERVTGEVVGDVMLSYSSTAHQQVEIGYVFLPAVQGQGYATEAATALVDVAFDQLGAHRVHAHLDARNAASARVLERLGMRKEAHLVQNEFIKGEWTDDVTYGILASEWAARRAPSQ